MSLDEKIDEMNRVTLQYIEDHPVDWDSYIRGVTNG